MKTESHGATSARVDRRSLCRAACTTLVVAVLAACVDPGSQRSDTGNAAPDTASPETQAERTLPAAAPGTSLKNASTSTAPLQLRLQFTESTWADAVADGGKRASKVYIAGEEMVVNAEREIVLSIGNGGAVRATLNGRPYPIEATSGQVVRDLVIKATAESQ